MQVLDRFLHYVSFDTESNERCADCPSTPGQKALGAELVREMQSMGVSGAYMDDNGYVYGWVEATPGCESLPCIGFIAHMDTATALSGANIKPRVVRDYDGQDILLNEEKNIVMRPAEFPHLLGYKGCDLVVTDGTTLLGGDDKAGIAEILTMAQELLEHPEIPHGRIALGFTPDEEIGRGADRFDVKGFGAAFAYTVDGGGLGELEYENFNAAAAHVQIHGISIHPGDAKGKMKNSLLIAGEFQSMMPPLEIPANTQGYEGFYHLQYVEGSEENTVMDYIIRDHDMEKFTARKAYIQRVADYLNAKYGSGTVELTVTDSYYNMKEKVLPHTDILDRARAAYASLGIETVTVPIRGGTDGARLSFMGLPCPNLSTGGHNGHGRFEYVCVQAMEKMVQVLVQIAAAR